MKILQLIPSLVSGGAEQATVDINAALVKAGHVSFVASSGGGRAVDIAAAGGTHVTLPLATKNPVVMLANIYRLAELIKYHQIDILHARSRAPAWSGYGAARLTRQPFITTYHAAYAAKNMAKKYYNSVMARGVRIIAISEFIATHIKAEYPETLPRIVTIPRGIDMLAFNPVAVTAERVAALRTQWRVPAATQIILMPARVSRIKGHATLIAALRLVRQSLPNLAAHTVIVGAVQGRDDYVRELHETIAAAGLTTQVTLAEQCRDMPAAYAAAALVVAPSLVPEGFGRVPIEAQAMGVPVIASALGAFQETIVPNVTGWLVPPGEATALAEKIILALTCSPDARATLVAEAQRRTRDRYAVETMTAATLEVYRQILAA